MSDWLELAFVSAVEYVYLVLLWMAFVSQLEKTELEVGLVVALVGTVADAIVKSKGLGHFRPRFQHFLLTLLEPWYILKGVWTVVKCFPRALKPRHDGYFMAMQFDAGEEDAESATRRALAVMLLTIPPNSIVIGIDREKHKMLAHHMEPEPPSLLARELGVQEGVQE